MSKADRHKLLLQDVIATLADHTNDAIVITEAEPVRAQGPIIVWVNNAFTRMTGFTAEEVIGKTPRILQRDDVDPEARQRIYERLSKWQIARETLKNYRKDGTPFWVELNIRPVADEAGWYHYWVAVQRDVTNQVIQTQALQLALEEAKVAEESQALFLSTMSHELRTPLNGVLGSAQLIPLLGTLNSEQQHALQRIHESGAVLLRLIENILDLSRLRAGMSDIRLAPCDIRKLVDQALSVVQVEADRKELEIFKSFSPNVVGRFVTDERRLLQILVNLIGNSVKFTDEGSIKVKVKWLTTGQLEINVQDTGQGVPLEHRERIFQPFVQLQSGLTRTHEGAGLGLAVSRHFARELGGDLSLESKVGVGSTFTLTIPVEKALSDDKDCANNLQSFENRSSFRVLIVEDNAVNREIIEQAFRLSGWVVSSINDGGGTFEEIESFHPDLLILDRHLPTMNGDDVIRKIRLRSDFMATIPIIALTADATADARSSMLSAGASEFFSKPADIGAIVRAASDLVTKDIQG